MAVLTPVLTRRLQIEASLNATAAKERLEASVAWLEDMPDVRFTRVGYSLTWLLMLDLPKSAKPLCAARHGDTVRITRTPGSWQTSLQPTGVRVMRTVSPCRAAHRGLADFGRSSISSQVRE